MITAKDLATACDVTDKEMSNLLRNLGIGVLLDEATRLQSMYYWDNKMLPPKDDIDVIFVKEAYESFVKENL